MDSFDAQSRAGAVSAPAPIRYLPLPMTGDPAVMGFHRHLLGDRVRTETFLDAIRRLVKPGDVVADIGSGSGIFSLAACRAGASKVYAVEQGSIIEASKDVAAANECDQIVFIQSDARALRLPEPVDVIVSECLGFMGMGRLMAIVADVSSAYLKRGGLVIPRECTAYCAPVDSVQHSDYVHAWDAGDRYGFDFSSLQATASSNAYVAWFERGHLLSEPQVAGRASLAAGAITPWGCELTFPVERQGTLHGFAGWFEADLGAGQTLTSSPFGAPTTWQQLFLPAAAPQAVGPGDQVKFSLSAEIDLGRDERSDCFTWATEIRDGAAPRARCCFRQSTSRAHWQSPRSVRTIARRL